MLRSIHCVIAPSAPSTRLALRCREPLDSDGVVQRTFGDADEIVQIPSLKGIEREDRVEGDLICEAL